MNGSRQTVKRNPPAPVMALPAPGDDVESSISETQNHSQQSEEYNAERIESRITAYARSGNGMSFTAVYGE
eukprot:scaffold14818_cov147-Amphora_coffeaeformis.AAC.3